ncbi:MAG: MlaD family protein [Planctomycetaceae bacterium]
MSDAPPPPSLVVPARRTPRWIWLLPLAALAFAVALGASQLFGGGPRITISFHDGHGIKAGDPLRCRGITVGQVESVAVETEGVLLEVRLSAAAGRMAVAGSRFWVVRPSVTLSGVTGLDTIAGPRYLNVLPGPADAAPQERFVGLDEAPALADEEPGGLELALSCTRRAGLVAGAPVSYRQVRVGTIVSVGLAADAVGVEVRAYIRPAYRALVRDNSRFWLVSGTGVSIGLSGVRIDVDSLAALLEGGIALATPDSPGRPVSTGHRFALAEKPEEAWLKWKPALPVGSRVLPDGLAPPLLLRATTSRTGGRLWSRTRQVSGWLLPTPRGLLGPEEMLLPEEKAELEVAGRTFPLDREPSWRGAGLARVDLTLEAQPWPDARVRRPEGVEECFVFADAATPPLPLGAARLRAEKGVWVVDRSLSFDESWHGAAVLARSDGMLVGVLLVAKGSGTIAPP